MARQLSAVDVWKYGHEVLGLTRALQERIGWCSNKGGNREHESFRELQEAIAKMHALLSKKREFPPGFQKPPPPRSPSHSPPPPPSPDDIPF